VAKRRGRASVPEWKRQGFRSGLEFEVYKKAKKEGYELKPFYECRKLKWIAKEKTYVPDFVLPNDIVIEVKGRFTREDRAKHLCIKEQHPELEVRFVFGKDERIVKGSSTYYSDWCESKGFKYAFGKIPKDWLKE